MGIEGKSYDGVENPMNKAVFALMAIAGILPCSAAQAAYTRTTTTAPVLITQIYHNEMGSPFVYFSATVNAACSNGNGLYLYDINYALGAGNTQYQNGGLAITLMAMATGKQVTLDYYYDPGVSGWALLHRGHSGDQLKKPVDDATVTIAEETR